MDLRERMALLSEAAAFDDAVANVSEAASTAPPRSPVYEDAGDGDGRGFFAPAAASGAPHRSVLPCVSHHTTPDGLRRPVLKVLQTSACENNCNYCAFRAGRDTRRTRVTADEMARSFDLMYRAGLVEGMFLSSGVIGTNRTMDEMLATAELARVKYGFTGYIHLKVLPNAEPAHVERAVELADRVSVNLEGPTQARLTALAPKKQMEELMAPLREAARLRRKLVECGLLPRRAGRDRPAEPRAKPQWGNVRLGLSTQFVVGPAGESDRELLTAVNSLYRELGLSRAYYSAFTPVKRTPFETAAPTDPAREHRLYQADWLLRFYGFSAAELSFDADDQLRSDVDPKSAWARAHPEHFPIEINHAPYLSLLRIPGVGPQSARAIIEARRIAPLREIGDLKRLGARGDQAAPYVLLSGRKPPYQPQLPAPVGAR